ncbi:hypothetical protein PRUPE_7G062900 [Prunus persica]|uniref:Rx N-terminal domain-containing protein n=1 Tax=Prunus persica TaxID=3760 RepID=A0A251N9M9_PRUPE|nr:hypothetical protein PRUPE_7G062900 [Prunus persica]
MADLVFPFATTLVEKLGSIVSDEISSAWGVQADLQKLERTVSIIKDVLLDAEQKQARNKQIRSWLKQLKDVFLDAENLLDEFECEALRREVVETFHGTPGKVRRFLSPSNPIAFRVRVGNEIKDISERLDELKSNCAIFDSLTILPHGYGGDDHERPFVPASKVIGRQYEKKQIVNLLMQQVGIGGLGKTTFAKWVYDDKTVVGHFDLRMWASVPVDFELTRLTRLILGSALDTKISDKLAMDQLQGRLREALKDKKFLLVLDDVWNGDALKWSQLRDLVIEGAKQEDSLSLFVECAFKEGHDKQYPSLFKMGEDIVRKCGGVPLAVKTLGSQLYSKTDEREWKLVRDSEIWKLKQEDDGHILPALRLSYTRMPPHLRQCLFYCSHLQKVQWHGIGFSSNTLIRYWMAHGILDQSHVHGNMELEDIGELYFKDLWARSFFSKLAQGECFMVKSTNTKDIPENVSHLTFLEAGQNVSTTLPKLNKVRTVEVEETEIDESRILHMHFLFKIQSLQTLNLCFCENLQELPRNIRKLISLTSLWLTTKQTSFTENGVGCLKSLRFLTIINCSNLTSLPREMSYFASLRTLQIAKCEQLNLGDVNYQGTPLRLQKLLISEVPRMVALPEWFQEAANTLQVLVIRMCENLEELPEWLTSFTSLRNYRLCQRGCVLFPP